ncbi:MAG: uL30 family ribosomal protein [Candidatus Micrarchaeota archaeon]
MKYAVVRVRGVRNIAPRIRKTLELLQLTRPNHCVLVEDTPQNMGMLRHAKDYVAYGPVSEETILSMLKKRAVKDGAKLGASMKEDEIKNAAKELAGGKKTSEMVNPVFRLSPPSKGYGDKKRAYPNGELGKRPEMDSLLRRMI